MDWNRYNDKKSPPPSFFALLCSKKYMEKYITYMRSVAEVDNRFFLLLCGVISYLHEHPALAEDME